MRAIFLLILFGSGICFADSITLYNDSAFELTAIVQSATGKVLAQKTFHPGEQSVWNTDQTSTSLDISYNASTSYTPYTVVWRCSYEGFYSVCYDLPSGGTAVANSCPGSRFCKPKPKEDKDKDKCCRPCRPDENGSE